ncbi:MAG: Flp pilus assembly protein CpaB [Actinobacteria bacterium]|nr:Flp pilus assembly protein CpaB [Actinomycetota bacterium]
MKIRIVLLFLAIIFGIAAVVGVMFYINNVRSSVEYASEKINAMVAVKDIPGDIPVEKLISDKLVVVQQIPRQYLVVGALASLDQFKGYITASAISQGEQITPGKFIKPSDVSLSFIVPEGTLAVSIPIDEIKGVSNLINVGDRVNIIATFQPQNQQQGNGSQASASGTSSIGTGATTTYGGTMGNVQESVQKNITKTLLWNVQILHIGNKSMDISNTPGKVGGLLSGANKSADNNDTTAIKTVTLALTPEQSEKLVFSEELGDVWLALVPLKGIPEKETPGRTLENIFGN